MTSRADPPQTLPVLRRWLRVLWVCRVAAAFSLIALTLFFPQVTDMLIDLPPGEAGFHWTLVIVSLLVWLALIYLSARRSVESPYWAVGRRHPASVTAEAYAALKRAYGLPAAVIPMALPLLALGIVVLGVNDALWQTPAFIGDDDAVATRERDHLLNLRLLLLPVGAAFVVSALALNAFRSGPGRARGLAGRLMPPFLPALDPAEHPNPRARAVHVAEGLLVAASLAVLLFIWLVEPAHRYLPRLVLVFMLFGIWIPVLTFVGIQSHRWRLPLHLALLVGVLAVLAVGPDNHAVRTLPLAGPAERVEKPTLAQWVRYWKRLNCEEIAAQDCRPILVAASGGASRAAFLTASSLGHFMDLDCRVDAASCDPRRSRFRHRVFAISPVSGSALGTMAFVHALAHHDRLAAAGGETQGDGTAPPRTPAAQTPCRPNRPPAPAESFLARLGTFVARRIAPDPFVLWHGYASGQTPPGEIAMTSWQDCMEALVAGDFISPVLAALLTRDLFPLAWTGWPDRAAVLEAAMAAHAESVLLRPALSRHGADCDLTYLCTPFLSLWGPQMAAARDPGACTGQAPCPAWLPLVISNGSSTITGTRLLTMPLSLARTDPAGCEADGGGRCDALFLQSRDVHDVINPNGRSMCPGHEGGLASARPEDVSIATAITNSARFPVISPEGDLECIDGVTDGRIVRRADVNADRIVDGGYFESIGATTLLELAAALREEGLRPRILMLLNEPWLTPPPGARRAASDSPGDLLFAPLAGVVNARTSRGLLSERTLERTAAAGSRSTAGERSHSLDEAFVRRWIAAQTGGSPIAYVRVPKVRSVRSVTLGRPEACMDSLSMNWWLSASVQRVLRNAVGGGPNTADRIRVCAWSDPRRGALACAQAVVGEPALLEPVLCDPTVDAALAR